MPGKGAMPVPNCPAPVTWSGTEKATETDANNGLAAYKAAYNAAEKLANAEMSKFEAQGCPAGCAFESDVRADAIITVTQPIKKKPVKKKGMVWVCDLTWDWSDTIYCYATAKAKKDADDARAKAKRDEAEAAKKDG